MPASIDFYFDFSSPYGFIASEKVEALASKHQRNVQWHPMMLGVVFKQTGGVPLTQIPIKGDYSRRDFTRSAAFHDVAFRMPSVFPISTQAPARIVLWLQQTHPGTAVDAIHALYRAYFVDDVDISNPDRAAAIAGRWGVDPGDARSAVDNPDIKDRLRRENEQAIAAGVFGSPFIIVDGEPFWGMDRFDQIERWLVSGAWL